LLLKTLLNRLQKFKGFVYCKVQLVENDGKLSIEVRIRPRKGSAPLCSCCLTPGGHYDTLPERRFEFVPLWGVPVRFLYPPRRVNCQPCRNIVVESLPWAVGKERSTTMLQLFLSHWARKLSWKEVAEEFGVGWNVVYRAVAWVVGWGLVHRDLSGVEAIGVDELLSWRGHRYVTMVYQIDAHCRRLLWIAKDRTAESFSKFFDRMGDAFCQGLRFVCSDMWKGYLKVVRKRIPQAIHVLDRFHIVANLNKALDEVRANEARRFKLKGDSETLKHTRWCLLKKPKNLTCKQRGRRFGGAFRGRLRELLTMNLKTVRAYLLARDFQHLWEYQSATWAGKFLDIWCRNAMRSRLEPMGKIARQLREHRDLILNYFRAKKAFSSGVVEALNNNAKLSMRKAYGFRTFAALEIALFHQLGELPEPPVTHKFW